jgi:hypothetical protein
MTSGERTTLEWWEQAPPVLMPVPAGEACPLTGSRVVVMDTEHGVWLFDQRAVTEPHKRNGQQVVGVLDEAEWYRVSDEPEYLAIPHSRPLDNLFVEQPIDVGNTSPVPPRQDDLTPANRTKSLIVDTTRPPVRWLRYAAYESELTGARAWIMTKQGGTYGWRVIGEPRRREFPNTLNLTRGIDSLSEPVVGTAVPVCSERAWYLWRRSDVAPTVQWAAIQFVWLE